MIYIALIAMKRLNQSTKMDYDYENWLAEMNVDEYPEYEIEDEE